MRFENPGDPVYAPNTAGGPVADASRYEGDGTPSGEIIRSAYTLHREDDDYGQPRALWENVLSDTDRSHLVGNVVGHASAPEVTDEMKKRVVEYWTNIHKDLGQGVAQGLGVEAAAAAAS